ncbi:MAG TPA: depupylase/deamidase Dop, partial [Acidimicrobiales bacterium]|nr:depupylase/deamidase Dop [Acidimicrobiales bacterium]
TEYGISGGPDLDPIVASSIIVNAYAQQGRSRINWDFEGETPDLDARGMAGFGSLAPIVETHLANTVLTNGARLYVDHAHPEYSSPECRTPLEATLYDVAGEEVMRRALQAANASLEPHEAIALYKNNSDGKGNSYGCHENYLVDRAVPFGRIARDLTAHLVTRQVYTGAGKVGCEEPGRRAAAFEISQRADFFEEEVGLETTLKRPIINTRDEPHADAERYRRLHVITGDANLAEVAIFLKVGVTAIVLLLIEDDALGPNELVLAQPVKAMHAVSHDLTLAAPVELASGEKMSAIEVQWRFLDLARKYNEVHGLEALGDEAVGTLVLDRWESVLAGLESNASTLARSLDWVAKLELIDAYCARHRCDLADHRVQVLDLQYHDVRPARSLHRRLGMERVVTDEAIECAITDPPTTTRAYFRGECLKRYAESIVAANWDSVVFDLGEDPLRRVPMMEPLRGTAARVATLLEECGSAAELLGRLGGEEEGHG